MYTREISGFMEERRKLLAGEAERDHEDLGIHAPDIYDFEYFLSLLKPIPLFVVQVAVAPQVPFLPRFRKLKMVK